MPPIFETRAVTFLNKITYPDMRLEAGQTTFVSGASGTGKSTLLKLFNGVLSPSSGVILYKGNDIRNEDTIALRRDVVLVGQRVFLFTDRTIAENFAEFFAYRSLPAPDEARMKTFMDMCGADFPLNSPTAALSGGEQQRVYNAIFASFEPPVIMLDEPTSALDREHAEFFLKNIISACCSKTTTLIIVSHDQSLVEKFADKVISL